MTSALHPIDLAVVVAYLLVVIAVGVWVTRRTKTGEDLFLAGRSLGVGAIGFSLFASNISAQTLIGLSGDAYATGIAVSAYEWMAGLILVFAALFVLPHYFRERISTVPEFMATRFDGRVRVYLSVVTILLSIVIDTAGGLYAGALVLDRLLFPVLDGGAPSMLHLYAFAGGLGVFAAVYTAAGGLKAVVLTDVLQAVILIVGSAAIAVVMFGHYGFSWNAAAATLPPEHLSMIKPIDDPGLPWPGLIVGVPLLGFYYWVMNQYIIQRALGGRDLATAQKGALLGGALKLLPLFIMILPAALALDRFPDIAQRDQVFPVLVTELLPVGLTGLVLAGLIAAIMSSVDSTLNSAATLVTLDFVKPRVPDLTEAQMKRIGRACTFGFMFLAVAWAPQIANFPGLWSYIQSTFAYVTTPLVGLFLTGLFWRGASARAGFWALLGGHLTALILFIAGPVLGWHSIHFTYVAGGLAVWTSLLLVALSYGLRAPDDPQRGESGLRSPLEASQGLIATSLVLVAATTLMVFVFR